MTLAQLQRDFRAYIVNRSPAIESAIAKEARRGLAVYHHAFRANLVACLNDAYEKTAAWLGEEAFERAALGHIEAHPPTSWTLSDYGGDFDATLAARYPADPEVAEMAWLDWRLRRAFDGPDARIQDPAALAGRDWEQVVLRLAPTLALREVETNVAALWSGMAEGGRPPPAEALDARRGLAVWRRDLSPQFRTLDCVEYRALERAHSGATFGEICMGVAEDVPPSEDPAAAAGGLLGRWFAEQIVIGAEMPTIAQKEARATAAGSVRCPP
jgi:hypothetical protein